MMCVCVVGDWTVASGASGVLRLGWVLYVHGGKVPLHISPLCGNEKQHRDIKAFLQRL